MSWFSRKPAPTDAERRLAQLQERAVDLEVDDDEVAVHVVELPRDRSPGSPLVCLNDGRALRVGEAVALETFLVAQPTTVTGIVVDGVSVDVLGPDQRGLVTLDLDADLSETSRTSILCAVDDAGDGTLPDGWGKLRIHTAEADATVRGGVRLVGDLVGTLPLGQPADVSPWPDLDHRQVTVHAVEEHADGTADVVVSGRDAAAFERGDEVTYVRLP